MLFRLLLTEEELNHLIMSINALNTAEVLQFGKCLFDKEDMNILKKLEELKKNGNCCAIRQK